MQSIKDVEQKAEVGLSIIADKPRMSGQQDYEQFKARVKAFLEDYQGDKDDFLEIADVTELARTARDLEIDAYTSTSVQRLYDHMKQIKDGYNGVIKILEELQEA